LVDRPEPKPPYDKTKKKKKKRVKAELSTDKQGFGEKCSHGDIPAYIPIKEKTHAETFSSKMNRSIWDMIDRINELNEHLNQGPLSYSCETIKGPNLDLIAAFAMMSTVSTQNYMSVVERISSQSKDYNDMKSSINRDITQKWAKTNKLTLETRPNARTTDVIERIDECLFVGDCYEISDHAIRIFNSSMERIRKKGKIHPIIMT